MIKVTKINGDPIVVNADLIEFVEETPDTVISLCTGKKLMVRESVADVIEAAREHRRSTGSLPAEVVSVSDAAHGACGDQGG
jgi:flagellar protein FlbD